MQKKFETYFLKALHDAKLAEIASRYNKDKRYEVLTDDNVIDFQNGKPDIVVKTKTTMTVFEVRILPISQYAQRKLRKLRDEVLEKNYKFRLVTIVRPVVPEIEVDWLNDALYDYFIHHKQDVIEEMATHAQYTEVDAMIHSIIVDEENIASVYVYGTVCVMLQFGNDSDVEKDDGLVMPPYRFPFQGRLFLDMIKRTVNKEGANEEALIIDISSWYGSE